MFQFPRLPPTEVGSRPSPAGFPHSGTPGSKAACASPGNIAACRALRRPPVPRHPPRALRYHALPPQGGGAGADFSRTIVSMRKKKSHELIDISLSSLCGSQGARGGPRGPDAETRLGEVRAPGRRLMK